PLMPLLENTLQPLERLAQGRHITLNVQPIAAEMTVWADPDLLSNVIYQITHNAIKFNNPGGHVDLSVSQDIDGTRFEFRDDGHGIPPKVMHRLGQDFNQLVDALK